MLTGAQGRICAWRDIRVELSADARGIYAVGPSVLVETASRIVAQRRRQLAYRRNAVVDAPRVLIWQQEG